MTAGRLRAENFLNEKNVVTDVLGKMEEKTGIRKKIIAFGKINVMSVFMVFGAAKLFRLITAANPDTCSTFV
uniref:Uncharacterized protein n=1 Tax=Stegastes partitus TaxID=144197 RepID=A0A3B5ASB9_9TELE